MKHNRPSQGWRDEAINEALRASALSEGDGSAMVNVALRVHLPDYTLLSKSLDRAKTIEFLRENGSDVRRLVSSPSRTYGYQERTDPVVSFDWYSLEWQERRFEVAMPPSGNPNGIAIFAGPTEDDVNALVQAAAKYAIRPRHRCLRFSNAWESAPDIDAEIGAVTWDDIVLPPKTIHDIKTAIEGFFAHEDAYTALGFPWRRGILLVGPPGTGKTMICKAAASSTNVPYLYVRDVREQGQAGQIRSIFERARMLAPCILVFEDMDGFVTTANRTVFLNELDGFNSNNGLLILASSNHPEKIDDALLKRPSRFDRVVHISLPDINERREYCRRLIVRSDLGKHVVEGIDVESLVDRIAERTEGFTPAYLKEVFVSAALSCVHEGSAKLDLAFTAAALQQVDEFREFLRKVQDPAALAEIRNGAKMGLRG